MKPANGMPMDIFDSTTKLRQALGIIEVTLSYQSGFHCLSKGRVLLDLFDKI